MRKEGEEILKQVDANSCLACSLLLVVEKITGQRFSKDDEKRLCFNSFGCCRESFVLSYLLAFKERFPDLGITFIVDNEPYRKYLEKLGSGKIQIDAKPITIELIRDEASGRSLVVFVDRYFFDYEIHIPHYVVVENREDGDFLVSDPWQGETLSKTPLQLQEAIFGVKYILQWAPMVIKIDQQSIPAK